MLIKFLDGSTKEFADLQGANLQGADLLEGKIEVFVFIHGYSYETWVVQFENGAEWIRMGCLWKSVKGWETVGIKQSNISEFPDDGSVKSLQRELTFNFAMATLLLYRK